MQPSPRRRAILDGERAVGMTMGWGTWATQTSRRYKRGSRQDVSSENILTLMYKEINAAVRDDLKSKKITVSSRSPGSTTQSIFLRLRRRRHHEHRRRCRLNRLYVAVHEVEIEAEQETLKSGFHFTGSRVETRRFRAMGHN
jgi:hypothetical protein